MNINLKNKATKVSSFLISLGILSGLITTAEGKSNDSNDDEYKMLTMEDYPIDDLEIDNILVKEEKFTDKKEKDNLDLSISNEEKIDWILKKWDLTKEELRIIMATLVHEGGYNYVEGYAVINNVYNRTISKLYSPKENQRNLYYQLTRAGQYNSYLKGSYKKYLNLTIEECPAMQAMVDFLYQDEEIKIIHHYLGFGAGQGKHFTSNGNGFRKEMSEDDYLIDNFVLITEEEINAIAEVGGFANYYKDSNTKDSNAKEKEITEETNEDNLDAIRTFGKKTDTYLRLVRTK